MRGLSLRQLSDRMGAAVSYNALHKYETGEMLPGSDALIALSNSLDQPVDFFFRPFSVNLEGIEFRKKSSLGAKKIREIREEAADFFERYLQLEEAMGLETRFGNPIGNSALIQKPEDVEVAAIRLREAWSLGLAPLGNVIELLEHHQVKILVRDLDLDFDGFAGFSGSIPVIVVNNAFPADRVRLTALHELGHLLLEFDGKMDEKSREKACHRFAGAMLIPKPIFESEIGLSRDQITLLELKGVKAEYGISIAAIMARAFDLGTLSKSRYTRFSVIRKQKGWHRKEPGEYKGEESSHRFQQLLHRAVSTEAISMSLAASLAKKPLGEFRQSLQFVP